jgi:hypothetical protein
VSSPSAIGEGRYAGHTVGFSNRNISVGTHEDRTSVRGRDTNAVPTVPKKDTGAVSKDTVGGGSRDRRAACSPVPALRKTYASAVRGK